jgi:hypothetical protein
MQLSAANLLIASQQIARGAQQPPRDAQVQFTAALAKEKSTAGAASFEPMDFKQTAPDTQASATASPRPAAYGASSPLGANLDIRV